MAGIEPIHTMKCIHVVHMVPEGSAILQRFDVMIHPRATPLDLKAAIHRIHPHLLVSRMHLYTTDTSLYEDMMCFLMCIRKGDWEICSEGIALLHNDIVILRMDPDRFELLPPRPAWN